MPLDLQRIRGLCFDIDGTLSDTDDQLVERLARLITTSRFLPKGRDPVKTARRIIMAAETPGNWLVSLPDLLGIDDELAPVTEFILRRMVTPGPAPYRIITGVIEVLEFLQPRFPMSIVSARAEKSSMGFLGAFNLLRFFPAIATALTAPHTKPYPDPVLWAAEKMELPPEYCLMIGDTVVDIRAGKAAGAQTVGVLCGFGTRTELVRAGADLILESTAELANVLGL
jgi:phosphoglycolate phosphatase-like HAD superfamily hydrolase